MSDRDPKFTSSFWTQVFKKLGTTLSMSSTDHPQSDGHTERVNQISEDMLQAYIGAKPTKWERYLQILEFAYNSSKHTSTGYSPFMYGFQPRALIELIYIMMSCEVRKKFFGIRKTCCILQEII